MAYTFRVLGIIGILSISNLAIGQTAHYPKKAAQKYLTPTSSRNYTQEVRRPKTAVYHPIPGQPWGNQMPVRVETRKWSNTIRPSVKEGQDGHKSLTQVPRVAVDTPKLRKPVKTSKPIEVPDYGYRVGTPGRPVNPIKPDDRVYIWPGYNKGSNIEPDRKFDSKPLIIRDEYKPRPSSSLKDFEISETKFKESAPTDKLMYFSPPSIYNSSSGVSEVGKLKRKNSKAVLVIFPHQNLKHQRSPSSNPVRYTKDAEINNEVPMQNFGAAE